jgi:hypothetical protein
MGQLGAQAVKDHLKSLARQGNQKPLQHCEALKGNRAKQEFALQIKCDREASFMQLEEMHKVEVKQTVGEEEGWLTKDQIAQHEGFTNYLDNEYQKQMLEDVLEGLPQRPHKDSWRAAKGHKQYEYSKDLLKKKEVLQSNSIQATATSVVDKDEFDPIINQIGDGSAYQGKGITRPNKPKPPPKALTPEEETKMAFMKTATQILNKLERDSKVFMRLKLHGQQMKKDQLPPNIMTNLEKSHKQCNTVLEKVLLVVEMAKLVDPETFNATEYQEVLDNAQETRDGYLPLKELGEKIIKPQ